MTTKPTTRKIAGKIYVVKRTTHNEKEAKAAASNIRKKYGKGTGIAKKLSEGLYAVYQLRTTVQKTATKKVTTAPKSMKAGAPVANLSSTTDAYNANKQATKLTKLQHIEAEIKSMRGYGMDTTAHERKLKAGMPKGYTSLRAVAAAMMKKVDAARTKAKGLNKYQQDRMIREAKNAALMALKF
jgi:hypothetical protein